ncbi:MAG: NAD(P)-dependent glycerol-3-phosphate dehydrogenase [Chloroflexi bacterium]|nr:NAD(P)-dependent glycerol-3-phosphate dehydrogenase [Chloroflexota bacterium]MQC25442.1 NAD(P)-dependent glycerol-3-phosphate dehydrogenase [Chloroflexota bacterium]MQC48547.1 NAD(P)-dependent glycerol-3-phosphate dehydrogenase [Chloroflexota bacterium]
MAGDRFERPAVVGATAWGTTLAIHLARNGLPVTLLARDAAEAARLHAAREHATRLPGVRFPERLTVAGDPSSIADADLVCFVVPSRTLVANAEGVAAHVSPAATLLSAVKGIELATGRRMSEVLTSVLPGRPVAALSGPNLSREVAEGLPGSTVIATVDGPVEALRHAFHSTSLRVYTSQDVIGVEMGGALKNVIAIAAGMVDALGFGDNAKGALLTRGLAEMMRLGVACGADPLTFQGLAGLGDLVASSYSPYARNRRLGELVASGTSMEQALDALGSTAEGVTTISAARALAARLGVEMPITDGLHRILSEGQAPQDAITALMAREPRSER